MVPVLPLPVLRFLAALPLLDEDIVRWKSVWRFVLTIVILWSGWIFRKKMSVKIPGRELWASTNCVYLLWLANKNRSHSLILEVYYSINVRSLNLFVNDIMMYIAKIIYRSHCSLIVEKNLCGFWNKKKWKNDQKKHSKTQKRCT